MPTPRWRRAARYPIRASAPRTATRASSASPRTWARRRSTSASSGCLTIPTLAPADRRRGEISADGRASARRSQPRTTSRSTTTSTRTTMTKTTPTWTLTPATKRRNRRCEEERRPRRNCARGSRSPARACAAPRSHPTPTPTPTPTQTQMPTIPTIATPP